MFSNNKGDIYPDFISKDSKNRIIIDAKYKPKQNIFGKDYFQLLAYMFRFESNRGYYIYPEKEKDVDTDEDSKPYVLLSGLKKENNIKERTNILLKKIKFVVPNEENGYEAFDQKMKNQELELLKSISV